MNKEFVQAYSMLEKKHWWFIGRQKIILQFLRKHVAPAPLSILNIGAAGGASTQWLSDLGNVVSVETEPSFIAHLKAQHIEVVNASVTAMPFPENSFDLVCAFDVIEHVADDAAAMREMERVCKAGGVICVTVPAFKTLWSNHDVVNGHHRRYTKKSLAALVENATQLNQTALQYFNSLLFLPILTARKLANLFRKGVPKDQSDFTFYKTPGPVNRLFKTIFSAETSLLKFISFPFGVSLIAVWKKTAGNTKLPG